MLALKRPPMVMHWRNAVQWLYTHWRPARTDLSRGFSEHCRHESLSAPRPHERSPLTPTAFLPSLR